MRRSTRVAQADAADAGLCKARGDAAGTDPSHRPAPVPAIVACRLGQPPCGILPARYNRRAMNTPLSLAPHAGFAPCCSRGRGPVHGAARRRAGTRRCSSSSATRSRPATGCPPARSGSTCWRRSSKARAAIRYRVVNASITGDTTAGGRARLPALLTQHQPGGRRRRAGRQRRAARRQPRGDARRISTRWWRPRRRAGAKVLIVGMQLPPNYGPAYVREFDALFGDVAQGAQGAARARTSSTASARTSRCSSRTASIRRREAQPRLLDNVWPALQPLLRRSGSDRVPRRRAGRDGKVGVDALAAYPERIDVRSPSEFADDHIPGRDQPARCSTTPSARASARCTRRCRRSPRSKRGAALVARNIARILETHSRDKPRDWAPLVYCWRGGKRSGSLAHVLNEIGWRAVQLDGGYRAYRRHVVARSRRCRPRFRYLVICGLTGSGKSRLLAALAAEGAQVLDLEGLARHRGSLLGDLPDDPQPSQKWFESRLLRGAGALRSGAAGVRRVGEPQDRHACRCPRRCSTRCAPSRACASTLPRPLRVALLKEEYAHFLADPALLRAPRAPRPAARQASARALERTPPAPATSTRWSASCSSAHYDPDVHALDRAQLSPRSREALVVAPDGIDDAAFRRSRATQLDRAGRRTG